MTKALKVSMTRTNLAGEKCEGDMAVLRNKEEFGHYFKRRYGLNKVETKGMERAFEILIGWQVETVDWP